MGEAINPLKAWLERDGGLLRLRLARPKANIVDAAMIGALQEALGAHLGSPALRAVLLGGEPFTEDLLMWWNFVGRTHEEIVEYRSQWESESDRFGEVLGYRGTMRRIPAPPLPTTRLRPRQPPSGRDPR